MWCRYVELVIDLKDKIINLLTSTTKNVTIITGFVTNEAFNLVESIIKDKSIEKKILFKLNLLDFKNGSSSFDFRNAINSGWDIYIDNTIHAKNYVFDDKKILHGSANLTSNGLGLNHSRKDDNTVLFDYTENFKLWVEEKFSEAIFVDPDKLDQIEEYIKKTQTAELGKVLRMQKNLESYISKHHFKIRPVNSIEQEDRPFLNDLACCFRNTFMRHNAFAFSEELDTLDIHERYQIPQNQDWYAKYLIKFNETVSLEVFNYHNQLYIHTPRIYQINQKYFRQTICNMRKTPNDIIDDEDIIRKLLKALDHLFNIDIWAEISLKNTLIDCSANIKFLYFRPFKPNEKERISETYKNDLKRIIDSRFHFIIEAYQVGGESWD